MIRPEFARTAILLGDDAVEKLSSKRVLLFGLGGVGSYAAEAIARAGIGSITLVDHDVASESNINRQLVAVHSSVGRLKIDVMKERILDINPAAEVITKKLFYRPESADEIDIASYDFVLDAIDTTRAKVDIISRAFSCNTEIITCMGTGNRLDPTKIRIGDLADTSVCPLCRTMRKKLRKLGIEHVRAVFSEETPVEVPNVRILDDHSTAKRPTPGSISFVPAAAGMAMASAAVRTLLGM